VLPAHVASGGKALLAALPRQEVARLYENDGAGVDLPALHRELALIRRRGYAINNQGTEVGVTAVGVLVPGRTGEPVAALSLAIPSARFSRADLREHLACLTQAVAGIHEDLTTEAT
jgi:IclR family transcriptional regulator, acetate operon repressor